MKSIQTAIYTLLDTSFLSTSRQKWQLITFVGAFIPFFLIAFQPFGVNNYDPTHALSTTFVLSMLGFGVVMVLTLIGYEFGIVPRIFQGKLGWKQVVRLGLQMVVLASAIFLYYNLIGGFHDWRFGSYLDFIGNVSLLAMAPYALLYLYFQYEHWEKQYQSLNSAQSQQLFWVHSDNGKDKLGLTLDSLRYMEAQDNYLAVYYQSDAGALSKQLLRTTLSKMEQEIAALGIMRIHRSYMVNPHQIVQVSGKPKAWRVHLAGIETALPISRSYEAEVLARLEATHPI